MWTGVTMSTKGKVERLTSAHKLAQEKWQSSGLTDADAKKLKFEALTADQMAGLGYQRIDALKIPYFTPDGKPTAFYRIRFLGKLPGFAGTVKKPLRYIQPKGTLNEVYLPPLLKAAWSEVLSDPAVPLLITEGELKAAKSCAEGVPCLGLGGVDVWRAGERGLDMLTTLAEAKWTKRETFVVFDSDAATNENVVRAQNQLARALIDLGALVRIVNIPKGLNDAKQGLDDYLRVRGVEALKVLLQEALPTAEGLALSEFNDEVVYIENPGFVIKQATGVIIPVGNFIQHTYANRSYTEVTQGKDGLVRKKKPLAPRWIQWPSRFQLSGLTYKPGQPRVTQAGEWNEWSGWGVEPEPGDIKPWSDMLDYVFKGVGGPEARLWFERWCAYPLQHPGVKLRTSVAIWSTQQGTGKTLIGYTLRDIYGKNAIEIKERDLHASFNGWAKGKQFVIGDEVTGSDKRSAADHLKGLITQEQIKVNEKYVPEYVMPDCINYYFNSNQPDAFFLDDTDRRYFIWEIVGAPAELSFYRRYDKWLKEGNGAAHLFHHLLHLDLGDFSPTAPAPRTRAKEAMTQDGKSDLGAWCHELKCDPTGTLRPFLSPKAADECDLFTATQLHGWFDPTGAAKRVNPQVVGKELKRAGLRQVNSDEPVRMADKKHPHLKRQRLYAVRNLEKWGHASETELADHYLKFFGPGAPDDQTRKF